MKEQVGLVRPSIDIIFISSLGLWRWSAGHIALSTPECTKLTCITYDSFLFSIIFKISEAGNFITILLVLNDITFMPFLKKESAFSSHHPLQPVEDSSLSPALLHTENNPLKLFPLNYYNISFPDRFLLLIAWPINTANNNKLIYW